MTRSTGPFKSDNRWVRLGWWSISGLVTLAVILGFVVLAREQQVGRPLNVWAGICRGLGITSDTAPASEPQPPLRTPTLLAWTRDTLAQISSGDVERGEFVAMNCVACHGEQGRSSSGLYPTLARMDPASIYKQLDDFRTGKRSWGAMNGIAQALSTQASADVAAYFASRDKGLVPGVRERPGEHSSAQRLVLVGDPSRGIPPCASCHGPGARKLGAPPLLGQQPAYIELQIAAFAQGMRQNDPNLQMRTIAARLKPEEMRDLANFYGGGVDAPLARR
jgi:cytochrome c553